MRLLKRPLLPKVLTSDASQNSRSSDSKKKNYKSRSRFSRLKLTHEHAYMICILVLNCWSAKPRVQVSPDYSRHTDAQVLCPEISGTIRHIGHTTHGQKALPRLSVSDDLRIQGNSPQMMVGRGLYSAYVVNFLWAGWSTSSTYQITKPSSAYNKLAVLHTIRSHARTLTPRDRNKRSWTSIQSNCKLPGSLGSLYSHPPTARTVQIIKKIAAPASKDVPTFIWIIKIHCVQA